MSELGEIRAVSGRSNCRGRDRRRARNKGLKGSRTTWSADLGRSENFDNRRKVTESSIKSAASGNRNPGAIGSRADDGSVGLHVTRDDNAQRKPASSVGQGATSRLNVGATPSRIPAGRRHHDDETGKCLQHLGGTK